MEEVQGLAIQKLYILRRNNQGNFSSKSDRTSGIVYYVYLCSKKVFIKFVRLGSLPKDTRDHKSVLEFINRHSGLSTTRLHFWRMDKNSNETNVNEACEILRI